MTSGVARRPEEIEALKSKILEYLNTQPGGTFSGACAKAPVPVQTAYEWRKEDPAFDSAVIVSRALADEMGGDLAESKLIQAINNGELTGIIFYLKTKHKARGYVERSEQEFSGRNGGPVRIETTSTADDELNARILELTAKTGAGGAAGAAGGKGPAKKKG